MRWSPLLLFSLLICIQSVWAQDNQDLFEKVFGRKKNSGSQELSAPLWLDEREQGNLRLRINNGQLDALGKELLDTLRELLLDEPRSQLEQLAETHDWLAQASLESLGIHSEYRANTLELHLQLDSAIRKPIPLSISQRQNSLAPTAPYTAAHYSAYGNLAFNSLFSTSGQTQYNLAMGGALQARGVVLEYQADALWRDELSLFRGPLSLVYDRPEQQQRLRLGDLLSRGSALLGSRQVAGFSWGREDALQPTQPPYPGLEQRIDVSTPTQLETRVNGQFVGRRFLQPGRYDLTDFPLGFGSSDVELLLLGLDGSQHSITTQLVRTPELLAARRSRYTLSAGLERDFSGGAWSYDTQRWVVAGFYQRGWQNGVSTRHSLDARGGEERLFIGNGLSYGLPFALSQIDSVVSRDPGHCCASAWSASLASYPARRGHWPVEWAVRGQYAGRYFGRSEPTPVARWQSDAELQWLIADGLRLGTAFTLEQNGGGALDRRGSLSLNYQPGRQWLSRFSLIHRRRNRQAGEWGITFALRFQWSGTGFSAGVQHNTLDQRSEVSAQYGQYHQRGGYAFDTLYSREPGSQRYETYASIDSTRASADLGLSHSRFANADNTTNVNLSARSAWVWADGHFGISRQINDSFALFLPPPDLSDTQVLVGAYDDDYLARSDRLGPAVIGTLRAYEQRGFELSLLDYPLNREPGELQPQLLPRYRSGVLVPVGGATVFIVRLQLQDARGQPLALQTLSLQALTGESILRSFSNKKGVVVFAGASAGQYTLLLNERSIDQIEVSTDAADENYVIQHGLVSVEEP